MMKEVKLEQGSQEWLAWRKTVITATDCSCIMGNNPWTTPYKCWQRKLGLIEEQKSNEAMKRGKKLEPEARAHFIQCHGINMMPIVVESSEHDFLGASLDGISEYQDHILEIKCGGANLHDMASRGEIPQYYLDQMQHQLLVTGAEKCFYYSYNGIDGIPIEILPDPAFKDIFMPKARAFWKCVAFNEPPSMQDADYKNAHDFSQIEVKDPDAKLIREWMEVQENLDFYKDKEKEMRQKILDLSRDKNCDLIYENMPLVRLTRIQREGNVDWVSLCKSKEITQQEIAAFRKEQIGYWKLERI